MYNFFYLGFFTNIVTFLVLRKEFSIKNSEKFLSGADETGTVKKPYLINYYLNIYTNY